LSTYKKASDSLKHGHQIKKEKLKVNPKENNVKNKIHKVRG